METLLNIDFSFIWQKIIHLTNDATPTGAKEWIGFFIVIIASILTSKYSISKYLFYFIRICRLTIKNIRIRYPLLNSCRILFQNKIINKVNPRANKNTLWEIPGSIALLSSAVGKIENMPVAGITMRIHLTNPDNKYDKRHIDVNKKIIDQSASLINKYYAELEQELIKENLYSDKFFQYQKNGINRSVIDILKEIYTPDNIEKAILDLNKNALKNKALHFNGDKIGICGYRVKRKYFHIKSIVLKVYETDHFSFLIFKEIYKNEQFHDFFKQLILRANTTSHKKKQLLVACLAFVFSSFGLDIMVDGYTASRKKKMLLAIRSKSVESNSRSSVHVPVNECFSKTDLVNSNEEYSLEECVRRGIEEEIGIKRESVNNIRFYDFAIVTNEGEIGISCHASIHEQIPLEKALLYPGQDKYMEISELLIVPIPNFVRKEKNYPTFFYKHAANDKLAFIWQSFTPLLYRRAVLHSLKENAYSDYVLNFILSIAFYLIFQMGESLLSSLSLFIITCSWTYVYHLFKYSSKYKSLIPFVPQWNGDVTVLQATGMQSFKEENSGEKGLLVEGMTFGVHPDSLQEPIKIEDLYLKDIPKCCVRRERTDQSECPLSFYRMKRRQQLINYQNNKLIFHEIPYQNKDGILSLYLSIKKSTITDKIEYSFTHPISRDESPILVKEPQSKETFLAPYSNYFKVEKDLLERLNFYKINTDSKLYNNYSQNFIEIWSFVDLFECEDNYYWSLVRKDHMHEHKYNDVFSINSSDNFYDKYIKSHLNDLSSEYTIKITGKSGDMEKFLNKFTAHPTNRSRINDLDIYMLQLLLIRWGITYANIQYR